MGFFDRFTGGGDSVSDTEKLTGPIGANEDPEVQAAVEAATVAEEERLTESRAKSEANRLKKLADAQNALGLDAERKAKQAAGQQEGGSEMFIEEGKINLDTLNELAQDFGGTRFDVGGDAQIALPEDKMAEFIDVLRQVNPNIVIEKAETGMRGHVAIKIAEDQFN